MLAYELILAWYEAFCVASVSSGLFSSVINCVTI
jgi:hypothetical protein